MTTTVAARPGRTLLAGVSGRAITLLAVGTSPAGAVLHGCALALVGAFGVAVAALASQLASDRAAATGAAVAVVVAGLLLRMVGDGLDALAWLRWLSPFGLAALAEPFGADRPMPLLVLATGTIALLLVVQVAARRRDLRDGLLPARGPRRPRTGLLGSASAFEVRGSLRPLTGWTLGIGAFLLLIGLVSRSMTDFLAQNPMFAALAAEAGFADLGSVEGYAATLFALLTVPVGGFVASRVSALAGAETARRLDMLLAGPGTRLRLVGSVAAVAAGGALVLTVVAGTAMWVGSRLVGSGLALGDSLAGAVSTAPVAALGLGTALLALGWAPRLVGLAGMLPAAGGFLLTVLADSIGAPRWVASISPLTHLAPVPVTPPGLPALAIMVAAGAALATVGMIGYQQRDLG